MQKENKFMRLDHLARFPFSCRWKIVALDCMGARLLDSYPRQVGACVLHSDDKQDVPLENRLDHVQVFLLKHAKLNGAKNITKLCKSDGGPRFLFGYILLP